ncbi:MAG: hypothetical protein C0594_04910 [Marinilabiliales bacterium]|nr:MAG: hypothetical protein C0594_04910 [Marinilabiliales bacterium]
MRRVGLFVFTMVFTLQVFANTDTILGWKKGGMISLAFSQVSLNRWAAGGQNSISGNGLVTLFANYKEKKSSWENNLELGYGTLKQGENESLWMKTDDKIDFSSKYGHRIKKGLYFAGLANFKSQFTAGYNYPNDSVPISNFMAPGYALLAIGLDYKPNDNFSLFLAPVTGKMTIVADEGLANAGAFGVEAAIIDTTTGSIITAGKKIRNEFGGYLKMTYKKDFKENISFATRLELFSNYVDNPQNIDIMWENILGVKITKFISLTLTTTLLYDDDVDIEWEDSDGKMHYGPTTQFKEVLGVGFSYKF